MSRRIPTWVGILILLAIFGTPWLSSRWIRHETEAESFRTLAAAESVEDLREAVGHLGIVFEYPDGSWLALRYRDSHGVGMWSSTVGSDSGGNWYVCDYHFCGRFKTYRLLAGGGGEGIEKTSGRRLGSFARRGAPPIDRPRIPSGSISPPMTSRTITLVMPSYNRGERIGKTLDSVLNQTRLPDEILVVNDGGFPATREFVEAHHPSVKVMDADHGGAALARNRGAQAAKGDWIVFFDDDDEMFPNAVETLEKLLDRFPEAKAAHADHTFTNLVTGEHWANHHFTLKNFERMWRVKPVKSADNSRLYDSRLFRAMLHGNLLQQPWVVERATFLDVGGFYAAKASDDWDLYLRITRRYPVALSDEVISHHYVEKDRPHLTQELGQEEAQRDVIRRVLKQTPLSELRTRFVLWRRLAMFHKSAGDRKRPESLRRAWVEYVRSFLMYPFDLTVAVRTFLWPLRMCLPW